MRSLRIHLSVWCLLLLAAVVWPRAAAAHVPILALAQPQLEGQLNPNAATSEQLELLPGIGPTTAARILEYVKKHPIRQLGQLMRVKGIGRKTYDKIRPYLILEGETTLRLAGSETGDSSSGPELSSRPSGPELPGA